MSIEVGASGKAKSINGVYVGVDGKAHKIANGWIGDDNGKAQRVFSAVIPSFSVKICTEDAADEFGFTVGGRNLSADWGDGIIETLVPSGSSSKFYHNYNTPGEYTVTLRGMIWKISFENALFLTEVLTPFPKNQIRSMYCCFNGCRSLTAIPADLFDNCTEVNNFSYCFNYCTAIVSKVPELWDATKWARVYDHIDCFYNCTQAANYADIPADWK